MRPVLEELDKEEATVMVGKIIRRKKITSLPELEESFRRSVEACGKSSKKVCKVIVGAIKELKLKGKVKATPKYNKISYNSQKA